MKDVTAVVSSPLQTEEPKAANHGQVRDQTLLKVDQQWINATQPQETSVKPYHWPQEKNSDPKIIDVMFATKTFNFKNVSLCIV